MATSTAEPGSLKGVTHPRRTATVLAWVMPHLIAYVAGAGHDATRLRLVPGLRGRDLADPDLRVPAAAAIEAWRLAQRITEDEAIGLHMAQAIPKGALDLLEYAFRSSADLGSALEQLVRYFRIASDGTSIHLVQESGHVAVALGQQDERQRPEFMLALIVRLAREATGTALAPLEVRFAHGAPEHAFEHRAFFRAPVKFDATRSELLIARPDLVRLFHSADAALSGVVRRRLDKMLGQLVKPNDSTAAQVRRQLLDHLARGEVTSAAICRNLAVSERTLHRRLRAEHTSFRKILDSVRGETAAALLREPGVGIAEIAFCLGYSEPAAFHRSFRRWTGQTPLAFRRGARPA